MGQCVICEREAGFRLLCGVCRAKAHLADRMADQSSPPGGQGCVLAVLISLVFWVTLVVCLWILRWQGVL